MFDKMFENAIIFGMDYDLFWEADPQFFFVYANAYREKQKILDANNFAIGEYVLLALQQVASDALSKSHKQIYPKQPFLTKKEVSLEDKIYKMMGCKK